MSQIRNIQLLLVLCGILLLAGCQNDSAEPAGGKQETMVKLIPITTNYVDAQRMGTRADYDPPTGYVPYDELYPTTMPPNRTIGVFLTPEIDNSLGNFIYQGKEDGVSVWKSTVYVTAGTPYYIYGYMPREDAETAHITPLPTANTSGADKGYAEGAVLTIQNYKTLTAADVCAVVGVRNATAQEKDEHKLYSPLELGKFFYEGRAASENFMFVLLKHLYAGIHIKAFIGEKYHKMRDIEITGIELYAKNIPDYVNLTLNLTANEAGNDPLNATYQLATTKGTQSVELFPYEGSTSYRVKEESDDPNSEGFLGCFVPGPPASDPTHPLTFEIETRYNVYDRVMEMENGAPVLEDGKSKYINHLIREGCVARNKIDPSKIPGFAEIQAGDVFTVNLIIEPDYLYQLSDPDLDNPTIITTTP